MVRVRRPHTFNGEHHQGDTRWPELLMRVRKRAEAIAGHPLNHCVINYYLDGKVGVGWHRDNESDIISRSTVVTVSLNETRTFSIKYKYEGDTQYYNKSLNPGSALFMCKDSQNHSYHQVRREYTQELNPRASLTFRHVKTRPVQEVSHPGPQGMHYQFDFTPSNFQQVPSPPNQLTIK